MATIQKEKEGKTEVIVLNGEEPVTETSKAKYWFCAFVICVMTGIQLYAWQTGHNGTVFAFTSFCIGIAVGTGLGVDIENWLKKR